MAVPKSSVPFVGRSEKESRSIHRQQSIFEVDERKSGSLAAELSRSNGSTASVDAKHKQSKQSLNVTVVETEQIPASRWGHTATYLPQSNIVLFVGGQIVSKDNVSVVTNDVYARDLSVNATQEWTQLSSENLVPHAYAARAVTHDDEFTDEKLFIVGGSTADCSSNASEIFMWKAGDSWRDGKWSVPTLSEEAVKPPRRRGARAMQVPVQLGLGKNESVEAENAGGVSFMLLGGTSDESTCGNVTSTYAELDIWTMGANAPTGRAARFSKLGSQMNTRAIDFDSQKSGNMTITDYSTVLLPANGTQGDRILFLGGMDVNGNLTAFNLLWVLDLTSSTWSLLETTNSTSNGTDIPLGRIGHSATRTKNGTIIVHGGYTASDDYAEPSSDVHVLDCSVTPAVWSKMASASDAPSRAFHTALMADDLMVVGFGQVASTSTSAISTSPVVFLDTANPNGWTWSDSIDAVVNNRKIAAASNASPSSTSTASTSSTTSASATSSSSITSASSTSDADAGTSSDADTDSSASAATTAPQSTAIVASPSVSSTGVTPKQRNTAVIASVLGAAAIAASLGGLYAAYKRREARVNGDDDSLNGDKYERFSLTAAPGPPVSSLWLNQPMAWAELKRKASLASEALLSRGRSTRRSQHPMSMSDGASAGSRPQSFASNYSMPNHELGFQVLGNLPATSRLSIRRNELMKQDAIRQKLMMQEAREEIDGRLPDEFLHSILDDDEVRSRSDLKLAGDGGKLPSSNMLFAPPALINRAHSSESLESVGGASHFSYPFLHAMYRPGMADSPSAKSGSSFSRSMSSPESCFNSPQFRAQKQRIAAHAALRSPTNFTQQLLNRDDYDEDKQELSRADCVNPFQDPKSPSAWIAAAACASSPLFPWDSPTFPSKATLDPRSQIDRGDHQSHLRVTNDDFY
ncbi:hypothetical protein CBS101457_003550 [Exobasidium rhododendri]|nr:hypothetical protein CBS101457_003550 [Exobasidium rhododendri]